MIGPFLHFRDADKEYIWCLEDVYGVYMYRKKGIKDSEETVKRTDSLMMAFPGTVKHDLH